MISTTSVKDREEDLLKCNENITKILERAVKLFRRTNMDELGDKWERILKTYRSKKQ
ncbi:MAG: hypothetical protein ACXABO_10415 [Promethearchaeota archaeon]|jgi:hypothetical protein